LTLILYIFWAADYKRKLTFFHFKQQIRTERNSGILQAGEQEIWTNVFNTVNPDYSIKRGTDLYLSSHTTAGVQYSQILLSCDDEHGSIYKLEPKTLEVLGTNKMRAEFGTAAANIVGDAAVGSTYNYALLRGINGHTYRYDLFSDFIGERVDASNAGLVSGAKMLIYLANRKPVLYNEHSLFQPGNGKVTTLSLIIFINNIPNSGLNYLKISKIFQNILPKTSHIMY